MFCLYDCAQWEFITKAFSVLLRQSIDSLLIAINHAKPLIDAITKNGGARHCLPSISATENLEDALREDPPDELDQVEFIREVLSVLADADICHDDPDLKNTLKASIDLVIDIFNVQQCSFDVDQLSGALHSWCDIWAREQAVSLTTRIASFLKSKSAPVETSLKCGLSLYFDLVSSIDVDGLIKRFVLQAVTNPSAGHFRLECAQRGGVLPAGCGDMATGARTYISAQQAATAIREGRSTMGMLEAAELLASCKKYQLACKDVITVLGAEPAIQEIEAHFTSKLEIHMEQLTVCETLAKQWNDSYVAITAAVESWTFGDCAFLKTSTTQKEDLAAHKLQEAMEQFPTHRNCHDNLMKHLDGMKQSDRTQVENVHAKLSALETTIKSAILKLAQIILVTVLLKNRDEKWPAEYEAARHHVSAKLQVPDAQLGGQLPEKVRAWTSPVLEVTDAPSDAVPAVPAVEADGSVATVSWPVLKKPRKKL